ncbi:MAG: M14 family zinc carboxypeptidase [Candidatus Thermoplasmatota archaeon]
MKKITCILIVILLYLTILPVSGLSFFYNEEPMVNIESIRNNDLLSNRVVVRIHYENDNIYIPKNSDVLGGSPGEYIDVLLTKSELFKLSDDNLSYSIVDFDYDVSNVLTADDYHTFLEMEQILNGINNNYSDITRLFSIGSSYEGRNIWCLEISDNPGIEEGEPGVLFTGVHHAREWPTMEICLNVADELTSNYGFDDNITNIVNNRRIWIVVCVNPDGYYYDHDLNNGNRWWRKNRFYFPEFGTYGVDLNRNYAGSCNGDDLGMWGSTGMSHNPSDELFCGINQFTESESQAIRDLIIENDICAVISWHTSGELVLWPWGYSKNVQAPDDYYLTEVGTEIATRITTQDGDGIYTPTQASGLYPTTGDTVDWVYGYGHYVLGRQIFPFTIEACESFHPSPDVLEQVCDENYDGALYLLQEAENISNLTPRVMPPIINDLSFSDDGNYIINWVQKNPDANVEYFQIDELDELEIVLDDCEDEFDLWNLEGFIISDSVSYSGGNSYQSHLLNNKVSSMTTVYPLPISYDTSISFWCKFDIEEYYDMAFFEASKDGRFYDVIDTFTGTSDEWIFKNYRLEEYQGESIFLRFRYSTDENTHGNGFYVDDIFPIANFSKITILSESLNDNFFEILDKSDGIYFYRVRGYNSEYGWGDFSTLERIVVGLEFNEPPTIPNIDGSTTGNVEDEYEYSFVSNDPEGSYVFYFIEWGDGENEEWIGPYESGESIYFNHTWNEKGDYVLRAKSRDNLDVESYWGTLEISMPSNKQLDNNLMKIFIGRIIEFFPYLKILFE